MRLVISELNDCAYDVRGQLNKQPGDLTPIHPFPGFVDAFASMQCFRALITIGNPREQFQMMRILDLAECFDYVKVCATEREKCVEIGRLVGMLHIQAFDALVVGSRLHSEITYGNAAYCRTAHLQVGEFGNKQPTCDLEIADYTLGCWQEFHWLQRDLRF